MTAHHLPLKLHGDRRVEDRQVAIAQAVIAGWTGRDLTAVERHIAELETLGVKRPASTPTFYRVAARRFTTAATIEVSGSASSGEVEYVLLQSRGRLWVGLGSDHTDRTVESYDVTVSKQMCDKPIAPDFWAFEDVATHWDSLILRAFVLDGGERTLYQEGSVAQMLPPQALIARFAGGAALPEDTIMMCGTVAARGGVRPSHRFEYECEDPVLGRYLRHAYSVIELSMAG